MTEQTDKPATIALIPARSGSTRVKSKNIRPLAGHPLIAYSIAGAKQSGIFDRVVVSTDSEHFAEIARYYGAEAPFLRPSEIASSVSPDIEWIKHALTRIEMRCDYFGIVRPTSPFRLPSTFRRAWDLLISTPEADSVRAVQPCREHPGKMWTLNGNLMAPLLPQTHDNEVPYYDRQYQDLPLVYVQNSSLEIARTSAVLESNTRGGRNIAPFLTEQYEGFSIDYEDDWRQAEAWIHDGCVELPGIDRAPYPQ